MTFLPTTTLRGGEAPTVKSDLRLVSAFAPPLSHELEPGRTIRIGKAPDADFHILDGVLSRVHAELHVSPSNAWQAVLRDLGSTNGTRIGTRSIGRGEGHPIQAGQPFRLGSVDFVISNERMAAQHEALHTVLGWNSGRELVLRAAAAAFSERHVVLIGPDDSRVRRFARAFHAASPRPAKALRELWDPTLVDDVTEYLRESNRHTILMNAHRLGQVGHLRSLRDAIAAGEYHIRAILWFSETDWARESSSWSQFLPNAELIRLPTIGHRVLDKEMLDLFDALFEEMATGRFYACQGGPVQRAVNLGPRAVANLQRGNWKNDFDKLAAFAHGLFHDLDPDLSERDAVGRVQEEACADPNMPTMSRTCLREWIEKYEVILPGR